MKRAAVAAVLAIGVAGIVVALDRSGNTSAAAAVKASSNRTVAEGSSRFTIRYDTPLESPAAVPTATGVMDYENHRGRIDYSGFQTVLLDGDLTYVTQRLPWTHEERWLRFESGTTEPDPFDLEDRATNHPGDLLRFLGGASPDVHVIGHEVLHGTDTTHYEGTLDLQLVVDRAPPDERADLQDYLDFIAEDTPTKIPFGAWVDARGVTHRLRIDEGRGASITVEYFDFGTPVVIARPPESEIVSWEELFAEIKAHAKDSDCVGDDGDTTESETVGGGVYACFSLSVDDSASSTPRR